MTSKHCKGLFITGTDTMVGKTYVGTNLVKNLINAGISTQARKPVESGCELRGSGLIPADGQQYYESMNKKIALSTITPYRYMAALAPPQAAALENHTLLVDQLTTACSKDLNTDDICIAEGAGGFYSPIANDGLNADLAKALNYPVLLVAANRLGCINHILLTLKAIESYGLETMAVILNQLSEEDASASSNASNLENLIPTPIISIELNQDDANNTSTQMKDLTNLIMSKLSV